MDLCMKKFFYMIVLAAAACASSSCNTFIGAGRDIQTLGSGMENKGHGRDWNGPTASAPNAPNAAHDPASKIPGTQQAPPQY
jgi:predicted small secreted protein|tara:strand:- start:10285 stop:10530 length:246 start_codon:yes stop_codon:yes gene_type:complete